jgi:hypothetical protein
MLTLVSWFFPYLCRSCPLGGRLLLRALRRKRILIHEKNSPRGIEGKNRKSVETQISAKDVRSKDKHKHRRQEGLISINRQLSLLSYPCAIYSIM